MRDFLLVRCDLGRTCFAWHMEHGHWVLTLSDIVWLIDVIDTGKGKGKAVTSRDFHQACYDSPRVQRREDVNKGVGVV
jgi:hypothetical protein